MMSDKNAAVPPTNGNETYPRQPALNPAMAQPQYLTQPPSYIATYPQHGGVATCPMQAGVGPIPLQPVRLANAPQVRIRQNFAITPYFFYQS